MTRNSTHSNPTRTLALLLLGAAISSGVVAAPTPSLMSSSALSTRAQNLQSRSSPPEQGLVLDLQRRGVEHVKLVSRTGETGQDQKGLNKAFRNLNLNGPGQALSSSSQSSNTHRAGEEKFRQVWTTLTWEHMFLKEQSDMLKELCTDKDSLDEIGSAVRLASNPHQLQVQNRAKLEDIMKRAEEALKAGIPKDPDSPDHFNPFGMALDNHQRSLEYIHESEEFKRAAEARRDDCLKERKSDYVNNYIFTVYR
ncbi:hypothetical protein F5880DRAFT_1599743 [Lentinula raphanica]|nr:hypothetical protein F5880DRAFT_1599743 [Lentinula raphanica]